MDIGILGNSLTHDVGSGYTGTGTLGLFGHAVYQFGGSLLTILTAVIAIGVAYLVFRFGWRKVKGSTK